MNLLQALVRAVRTAWQNTSAEARNERHLSQAVDIYDLERRMNERARDYLLMYPSGAGR